MSGLTSMTAHRLFVRRWRDRWWEKLGILRFTFDLTILLYLGVPALLLGGRAYYGLWREELPGWLAGLPYSFVPLALLFLIYSVGGLSFYIEAGDVLFLRQRPRWMQGLMLRGLFVSAAAQLLLLAAGIAALSPLLVRSYGMGWPEIGSLYIVAFGVKIVQMLIQQLLGVLIAGWRRLLARSLAYSLLGAAFAAWAAVSAGAPAGTAFAVLVLAGTAGVLGWRRFHLRGRFDAEVREEERQKTKLTALLLASAVDRPKTPRSNARPWLFRRLRRLTRSRRPEARIAEALVKAFFRGNEWKLYVQFVLAGLAAVLLPPYPVDFIVYAALLLLMLYWLSGHRRAFFDRELMAILPLGEFVEYRSAAPAMTLLLLPAATLFIAALGLKLLPPLWGLLGAVPCGALIAWWLGGLYGKVGIAFERKR
ncbi:ABC transporter permease [Paenibacillus macerans]|uniref:ABC transporter permease n=1 Tax=Paenibacillus macerans TaxID=44252 RepID=UPI003D316F8F